MKLSINHIIKLLILAALMHIPSFAQQESERDTIFEMQKSPWGAVLRSAVIPGWGQIYNQSYLKAAVIWGAAAWFIYAWHFYNDDYQRYRDLYRQNMNAPNADDYRDIREFYRNERDMFAIYLGLLYLMNLVDAYVDAHLFDFTVEENFRPNEYRIGFKINF